jgi:putative transposase
MPRSCAATKSPAATTRRRLSFVIGVREDGQKVLLALKNMGGETTEAWRAVLDDLVNRGLRRPAFLIVDGAAGRLITICMLASAVGMMRQRLARLRDRRQDLVRCVGHDLLADQ